MKKVKYFQGFWTVLDVKKNPQYLFIFGDNDLKKGKKGQAIIRGQKNAMEISIKKQPSYQKWEYYYDHQYEQNIKKIDDSIQAIQKRLKEDKNLKGIILPSNMIGTGLAKLNECAPKTFQHLQLKIKQLVQKLTKEQKML